MSNTAEPQARPTKYYIDFENVHGAGLKGVDALTERDEVIIIYSQAAETFHIEHAIDILKSQARIRFVEADAGTRNAADFQLIVALYADMDDAYDYAIVSGDGGFDAAIKMGERMGKPQVRRLGNIAGDEAEVEKPKSRRSRRSRSGRDAAKDAAAEAEASAQDEAAATAAESPAAEAEATPSATVEAVEHDEAPAASQEGEQKSPSSRRRSRRRKRSSSSPEEQAATQAETERAQDDLAPEAAGDTAAKVEPSDDASHDGGDVDAEALPAKSSESDTVAEEPRGENKSPDAPQSEPGAAKKPRKRSSKRTSTRKETDDAYARAAEAMRLASEGVSTRDAAAAEKPEPEPAAAEEDATDASSLVKNLLEQQGVQLSDAQIATVASALIGPDGRQGFYRRIIKIERQQNGRALYRQVRDHYEALLQAIQ